MIVDVKGCYVKKFGGKSEEKERERESWAICMVDRKNISLALELRSQFRASFPELSQSQFSKHRTISQKPSSHILPSNPRKAFLKNDGRLLAKRLNAKRNAPH